MSDLGKMPAERPPLSLNTSAGKVKMTYGLEMDFRRMLPDPAAAMSVALNDPYTQDYIIRRCFTPKKGMVTNAEELISADELELEPDDNEAIIIWAVSHVLYFFMKRSMAMGELATQYQQETPLPSPSTSGSEVSASTTQSAGLTE